MSHEIRTPMNGVLGMADLLLAHRPRTSAAAARRDHHAIGATLLTIINDILDFSRIEAGKIELEQQRVRSARTASRMPSSCWPSRPTRKELDLNLLVADDIAGHGRRRSGRLRQVLINLIGNAIKFTEHGRGARARPPANGEAGHVEMRFDVRDTGIGIDAGRPGEAVPAVHPGRHLDQPPLRRHRPRPVDLAPSRRADGRHDRASRASPARARRSAFSCRSARRQRRGGHDCGRRRARWPARAGRRRPCDQPRDRCCYLTAGGADVGVVGDRRAGSRPGRSSSAQAQPFRWRPRPAHARHSGARARRAHQGRSAQRRRSAALILLSSHHLEERTRPRARPASTSSCSKPMRRARAASTPCADACCGAAHAATQRRRARHRRRSGGQLGHARAAGRGQPGQPAKSPREYLASLGCTVRSPRTARGRRSLRNARASTSC